MNIKIITATAKMKIKIKTACIILFNKLMGTWIIFGYLYILFKINEEKALKEEEK